MTTDDSYLFGFTGVWHVRHADGTTEDIELTHGNLVEDAKGSAGQFILSGPAPQLLFFGEGWEPSPEELAAFEKALNAEPLRVITLPEEQGVSKVALRAALGLYYDVDADTPGGVDKERDDALRALERVKALVEGVYPHELRRSKFVPWSEVKAKKALLDAEREGVVPEDGVES